MMATALAFARVMFASRAGLTVADLAGKLGVANRTAARYLQSAELAGWVLERDAEFRWKLAR